MYRCGGNKNGFQGLKCMKRYSEWYWCQLGLATFPFFLSHAFISLGLLYSLSAVYILLTPKQNSIMGVTFGSMHESGSIGWSVHRL